MKRIQSEHVPLTPGRHCLASSTVEQCSCSTWQPERDPGAHEHLDHTIFGHIAEQRFILLGGRGPALHRFQVAHQELCPRAVGSQAAKHHLIVPGARNFLRLLDSDQRTRQVRARKLQLDARHVEWNLVRGLSGAGRHATRFLEQCLGLVQPVPLAVDLAQPYCRVCPLQRGMRTHQPACLLGVGGGLMELPGGQVAVGARVQHQATQLGVRVRV